MTDLIVPTRRKFITGLVSLLAAPAIVRASSLMPVVAYPAVTYFEPYAGTAIFYNDWLMLEAITREGVRLWKEDGYLPLTE